MLKKLFNQDTRYLWWALLGGFCYAAGFPLLGSTKYIFLAPTLGFIFLLNPLLSDNHRFFSWIKAFLIFSLGLYLLGLYWIPYTLKEFGEVPIPVNYLLGVLFSIFLLPQFYFLLSAIYLLNQKFNLRDTPVLWGLFLALSGTLLEVIIPQQFPIHLGHNWFALAPYTGLARYFGVGIFSLMSYFLAFFFILSPKTKKTAVVLLSILSLFLIVNIALGFWQIQVHQKAPKQTFAVKIVQANIGNNLKISAEKGSKDSLDNVLGLYRGLSTKPTAHGPDLIIWPETAYPVLLSGHQIHSEIMPLPYVFRQILEETGAYILFGGYDQNPERERYDFFESEYNSAFMLTPNFELPSIYHKHQLIPFGEGLPFGPLNRPLSGLLQNISFFAKGTEFPLFQLPKGTTFITAICYEILFPDFLRDYFSGVSAYPNFIINLTNDSWYGHTAEPEQHLFLAKWRALEFGLPIIRSTNTGITVVIYPDGSEGPRLGVGEVGNLDIKIEYIAQPSTFYARFGELFLWILWCLTLLIVFLRKFLKK